MDWLIWVAIAILNGVVFYYVGQRHGLQGKIEICPRTITEDGRDSGLECRGDRVSTTYPDGQDITCNETHIFADERAARYWIERT